MQCPNCHFSVLKQGPCRNCGVLIPAPPSFGRRHPVALILLCLSVLFVAVSVAGTAVYRSVRTKIISQKNHIEADSIRKKELAVEHGNVASPTELHAHGSLYFAPVGRQAIPVESLAVYYRQKFGIEITVLPAVQLPSSACEPARSQCAAEEVIAAMSNGYPEIARNPESVMIALTDEDIFPRGLGWDFTYSLHSERIGVVSSRRMDPSFWGDPPNDVYKLAATKQMFTKYIAMQYFHLADSFDPTSVLFSPLTPDGGPDDIYESDVHPEASANGQRGNPFPCLSFAYSYKTHEMKMEEPLLEECRYHNSANSTDEEIFETNLGWGILSQRSLDMRLNSLPAIDLRRGYNSALTKHPLAFGWGSNHSYNSWLSSDGLAALTYLNINHEDGAVDYLGRLKPGRGFDPGAVYESHDDAFYGAHLIWDAGFYKLQYRNGDSARFLPCNGATYCYWNGYQDAKGNSLKFDRDRNPPLELHQLMASDNQGVNFQSDDHHRTTQVTSTNGASVSYDYDEDGCLSRVHRLDGQITLYEYDPAHRMTSVSVVRHPGASPQTILTNEYDSLGRIVKQTLRGIGTYQIEYVTTVDGQAKWLRLATPDGETLDISIGHENYIARSSSIRFPRKQL